MASAEPVARRRACPARALQVAAVSDYHLVEAALDARWDAFVQASPHGSVYALSPFLAALSVRPTLYYCVRDDVTEAAVLLTHGSGGEPRSDHVVYDGIIGAPRNGAANDGRAVLDAFGATEFIAAELARRHAVVALQLSPAFVDIRPFLWLNHGVPGARYVADVRYTSYLDISRLAAEEKTVLKRARRSRRREIDDAREQGIVTREEFDPPLCTTLYRKTMERQAIDAAEPDLEEMRRLMYALHDAGLGRMFVSWTHDGIPASAVFLGVDQKRAYGMFGGSDPGQRRGPAGTAVLWDAFRALAASGVTQVDFDGVNSPRRGWFKLSFGGTLLPYYALTLHQQAAHG